MYKPVAVAALIAAVSADNVSPSAFRGDWKGSVSQAFAAVNPSDPNALECIGSGQMMEATGAELSVTDTAVSFTGAPGKTEVFNNARYTMADVPAAEYSWADFDGSSSSASSAEGIMKIRDASGTVVCKYGLVEDKRLVIVTLGGAGFTWEEQCQLATYQAIPDIANTPLCESQAGSKSPYRSTTLESYDFLGVRGSGAGSARTEALVAAVAVGGAVAIAGAAL